MKRVKIYQVDAFSNTLFSGNSAAVCPLYNWLDDKIMQSIAMENNLSETCFFIKKNERYYIRFFTPKVEIDLAGHPTLAAAHIIFKEFLPNKKIIQFFTKTEELLTVTLEEDILSLNFPAYYPKNNNSKLKEVSEALKSNASQFLFNRYGMAIFKSEKEILDITPNYDLLKNLEFDGIIVTAPGKECDFVSRFFAPKLGILEDPVTGSAHCELVPYWANVLNKRNMLARQLSERGGELYCSHLGERVSIGGKAITYMHGELLL